MKYLIKAIEFADLDNLEKLKRIFPHICMAHDQKSWDSAPDTEYPLTINIPTILPEKNCNNNYRCKGTFGFYLNIGGHFLTNFSHAILEADRHNVHLISMQYPQMIAAFHMPSWDMCPNGFEWNSYNSPQKMLEKTLDSQ
jgi:hypothetical protein